MSLEKFLGVLVILFVITLVVLGVISFSHSHKITKSECLRNIAQDFCEEKDLIYGNHWWGIGVAYFSCFEDKHQVDYPTYKFTADEIERCLG